MRHGIRNRVWVFGVCATIGALGGVACSSDDTPASPAPAGTGLVDGGSPPIEGLPEAGPPKLDASPDDPRGDRLTPDERQVFDGGSDSVPSIQQLAQIADSIFDFDPTIDPTKTADQNAAAITANAKTNLPTGCGAVAGEGATLSIDYGAPPGCTLKNGVTVSGKVSVTVSKNGPTIGVALTLTALVVNGKPLAGTAMFSTTNGTTFTVNANLTSGSTTYTITGLTVAASGTKTITVNGTVTTGGGDATTSVKFTALTWKLGDCYPNGGTMAVKKGLITTTVTFNAMTPTTGKVSVTVGKKTTTESLPTYGSCGTASGVDAGK